MNYIELFQNICAFKDIVFQDKMQLPHDMQYGDFRTQISPSTNGVFIVARNMVNGYDILITLENKKTHIYIQQFNQQIKIEKNRTKLNSDLLMVHMDVKQITNFISVVEKLDKF